VSFNKSSETFWTHRVHAIVMLKNKKYKKSLTFLF